MHGLMALPSWALELGTQESKKAGGLRKASLLSGLLSTSTQEPNHIPHYAQVVHASGCKGSCADLAVWSKYNPGHVVAKPSRSSLIENSRVRAKTAFFGAA